LRGAIYRQQSTHNKMALLARSNVVVAGASRPSLARVPTVVPVRRVAVRPGAFKGDSVDTEDVNKKLQEALGNTTNFLQNKWEETEDKPAAIAVTAGAFLVLIAASSVVDAIDKIPIVSDLIELVGIGVTGWFIWRFLLFGPDREELISNIKTFVKKVYGA